MSPVLFSTALDLSLALCALGTLWRASIWFRLRIGRDAREFGGLRRLAAALRAAASALFSRRIGAIAGAFVFDVLLLRRLFVQEKLRWLGHTLAVVGFALLLLMHALAPMLTAKLFPGYQPTLAPYLFLRETAGVMLIAGLALLYAGRHRPPGLASTRNPAAGVFVTILATTVVSGFLLAACKTASPTAFYRMTGQYLGSIDARELEPLRAFWASEYGVAFPDAPDAGGVELLERGRALHRESCASCHSGPKSAFVSHPAARALAPVILWLEQVAADSWLLYVHVFACFIGLASLPFTRFFHVVAVPLGLLARAASEGQEGSAANLASSRALALDACVHCGICDRHCSVAPVARSLGNPGLLPLHKLRATEALASGRLLRRGYEQEALRAAEGAFLCTDCGRCTERCPAGLDLADLWKAGRADLSAAGLPAPAQWVRLRPALAWARLLEAGSRAGDRSDVALAPLSLAREAFDRCVQCQTCTNVCPVVAHSIGLEHGVDLTPQKVMNLLRLGLRDLTLGTRMVWDCAACYQCQEYCPEGLRVADIMLELRALSVQRLGSVRAREMAS